MKVSTILDHIDNGHIALPVFQRGYVWNRDQVRGLMDSLYRRHPVGSLLVWATESVTAEYRGDGPIAHGIVKLLLDGQQRISTLYGIIRGRVPEFFDGNEDALRGLYFNVESEEFSFFQPVKMAGDPLWLDVTQLMKAGNDGIGEYISRFSAHPTAASSIATFLGRINALLGIKDIELHIEEVTGQDKTVEVVVDIFNRVNSGGTKLSKGDLALAKICGEWPEGRDKMKVALERWGGAGYHFKIDWVLRSVNTIATGEALFVHLDGLPIEKIKQSLDRATRSTDYMLNMIGGRLGLDHDRVFFGRYAMPVLTYYLERRGGTITDAKERDKLLYWYLSCAMWGRFSGSTESNLDQDLGVLAKSDFDLDALIESLRLWRGGSLAVLPEHFSGYGRGARFYPVLYLLSRVHGARDWGLGIELKHNMLGNMSKLERHHIFPKALLKRHNFVQSERNAVANFCFQTKQTNLDISDRSPAEYFREIERDHAGALASQWIPMDPSLWEVDKYSEFLAARRELLTNAINAVLNELSGGLHEQSMRSERVASVPRVAPAGGIDSDEEEEVLLEVNHWIASLGLPSGDLLYEVSDEHSGDPECILDLAWPEGLQQGLSSPVAIVLEENPAVAICAARRGFRCFESIEDFKHYVCHEVLVTPEAELASR
jgi:hypothetical protein